MDIFEHLKQFKIIELHFLGIDLSVTNGAVNIFLAAALVLLFYFSISRRPKLVPDAFQSLGEYLIEFVKKEMLAPLGKEGELWVPFIVTVFSYILCCNLLGLFPGLLPPTSNINVTASMAGIIFVTTQAVGIKKHGFFGYFWSIVPQGVPLPIAIFMFPIEIVGQLARPFSLAVRLFANMFAGHAIILILIGLILLFKSYLIAPLPVLGNVAIMGFEIFVSFIQAFIFTYLSASYIVGALQTEH